jgi:predicted NUDIX family NTP pyrophosphohydrolase
MVLRPCYHPATLLREDKLDLFQQRLRCVRYLERAPAGPAIALKLRRAPRYSAVAHSAGDKDYGGRMTQNANRLSRRSAGILMYRWHCRALQLLLVHPGGPYWARKDDRAWSIPKGLYEEGEDPLGAAKRELHEETGCTVPEGDFIEGNFDTARLRSNVFSMEWPPRSGRTHEFPEVDHAEWFEYYQASRKILKGQLPILNALVERLGAGTQAGRRG